MTVSGITQPCSDIESPSAPLDPGRCLLVLFVCQDFNFSSHCLSCFFSEWYRGSQTDSLPAEHQLHSWQQSTISRLHSTMRAKYRLQKKLFLYMPPVFLRMYIWTKSCLMLQHRYEQCDFDLFLHWDLDEHVARLPGRFCSALSQHRIIPLILEPFCMATPRQAPCGGSARKAVGQAEPSPRPMAGCWHCKPLGGSSKLFLSFVTCPLFWPLVLMEDQASLVLSEAVALLNQPAAQLRKSTGCFIKMQQNYSFRVEIHWDDKYFGF